MRRKRFLVMILLLLFVVSGYLAFLSSSLQTAHMERLFTGYLMCRCCAGAPNGTAADGVDVLKSPEKHTVQCLKMPACVASGFGMMIKNKTGNYTFYRFDAKGSDLAYQNVICKTAKTDNLVVAVAGKFQNNQIILDNITEK